LRELISTLSLNCNIDEKPSIKDLIIYELSKTAEDVNHLLSTVRDAPGDPETAVEDISLELARRITCNSSELQINALAVSTSGSRLTNVYNSGSLIMEGIDIFSLGCNLLHDERSVDTKYVTRRAKGNVHSSLGSVYPVSYTLQTPKAKSDVAVPYLGNRMVPA
jgi:hypothetical protein